MITLRHDMTVVCTSVIDKWSEEKALTKKEKKKLNNNNFKWYDEEDKQQYRKLNDLQNDNKTIDRMMILSLQKSFLISEKIISLLSVHSPF